MNFEIVNALKIALSEFISFCFKGGILEIKKLNLIHLFCVCVCTTEERFVLNSDILKSTLYL